MNPCWWGKFMPKYRKVLDFKDGGSIYVTEEDGFIPVGITKEDATEKLKKLQPTEEQSLALLILALWS